MAKGHGNFKLNHQYLFKRFLNYYKLYILYNSQLHNNKPHHYINRSVSTQVV